MMHPLRFPNSGIRAKIFMRKIGFKLCVMRLNRVESFYVFLLYFRSEGSPCKGQPGMATACPLAGAADHLQGGGRLGDGRLQPRPPARGNRLQPRPPAKGRSAAARPPARGGHPQGQQPRRHDRLRPGRKGLLPAARSQGAAPRLGLPPARAVAGRSGCQQVPPEGSSACRRGGCSHRRRAALPPAQGSDDGGGADGGKERAMTSF
ncbi:hypothetical protein BHM03_00036069 [Ensete ventricosum]|nr:hypothetical protein BHM03_00036069 [Ensete ventricosum]